jgi:hypothetical protein
MKNDMNDWDLEVPNNDMVICPKCVHQFRAIPVSVQHELADERERRKDAETALGEVVACHNSDPILIAREPGYRWHDVIKQAIAHFTHYKD